MPFIKISDNYQEDLVKQNQALDILAELFINGFNDKEELKNLSEGNLVEESQHYLEDLVSEFVKRIEKKRI